MFDSFQFNYMELRVKKKKIVSKLIRYWLISTWRTETIIAFCKLNKQFSLSSSSDKYCAPWSQEGICCMYKALLRKLRKKKTIEMVESGQY